MFDGAGTCTFSVKKCKVYRHFYQDAALNICL